MIEVKDRFVCTPLFRSNQSTVELAGLPLAVDMNPLPSMKRVNCPVSVGFLTAESGVTPVMLGTGLALPTVRLAIPVLPR